MGALQQKGPRTSLVFPRGVWRGPENRDPQGKEQPEQTVLAEASYRGNQLATALEIVIPPCTLMEASTHDFATYFLKMCHLPICLA